jgi:integrase
LWAATLGDDRVFIPICGIAAEALREWIERAGIVSGPVFREIIGNNGITERSMSGQAIYRLVRAMAKRARLPGLWGAHSLRKGYAVEAGRREVPIDQVIGMMGYTNPSSVQRY